MKKISAVVIALLLSVSLSARADELVFKGTLGLITYVKQNIHLMDTVVVGATSYLRYAALEGTIQIPLGDVIEIRFIPYDLTEISVMKAIPDTVAIPIPRPILGTLPKSVTVASISALKSALLDNTIDEIVVANGRYIISPSSSQAANSLWIGSAYKARTRPILVRAQIRGGVTFDGNGTTSFGGMSFNGGAHDQTWDGFNFTNGRPTSTGIIVFGGYISNSTDAVAAHHITMRYINIYGCTGGSTTMTGYELDHCFYSSYATGGSHDLLFENISIDDRNTGGLTSAFHFYHSDVANGYYNAHDVTIRNVTVRGTQQTFILEDPTLTNITISDVVVEKALRFAMFIGQTSTGIVIRNFVSTGSGQVGYYTSSAATSSYITLTGDSFK